jgi:prolipoprotein diacylglyceryltransferase
LGLYEALVSLLITAVIYTLGRKIRRAGFFFMLALLLYPIPRFFLDFLRADDFQMPNPRFWGLTVPQYGSVALVIGGFFLWRRLYRKETLA